MTWLWVALAGGVGAGLRLLVDSWVASRNTSEARLISPITPARSTADRLDERTRSPVITAQSCSITVVIPATAAYAGKAGKDDVKLRLRAASRSIPAGAACGH